MYSRETFYRAIAQCVQSMRAVELWLDKAEQHAAQKKFDVAVLLRSRLSPDQADLIGQIQFGGDYIKYGAARLSGRVAPKWDDDETSLDDVRRRIAKTLAYAQSVPEADYEGAAERRVEVNWAPGKTILGIDYLFQLTIPNVYFHLTTAYAILRHNGVDVGKADFLNPVALV